MLTRKVKKAQDILWKMLWKWQKLLINSEVECWKSINNLLLSNFISYIGCQNNIDGFRAKYLESWEVSNESNEQRRLLLILARILLKDSHNSCACIRYCKAEEKIQIAFPSRWSANFDKESWRAIQCLVNLQQAEVSQTEEINQIQRELFARAIVKDKASFGSRKIYKIKQVLFGKNENDRQVVKALIQLKTSINEFIGQWGEEQLNANLVTRAAVDRAMEKFFASYRRYYRFIRERWVKEEQPVSATLLEPLVHVHDINCWLAAIEENNSAYSELALVIKEGKIRKILTKKKQHAEMKMLEEHNFKVEIFTTAKWPAVITRHPCLHCWMTLRAAASNREKRRIIAEHLGFSGILYLNWETPTLPAERMLKIIHRYHKLAKIIIKKLQIAKRNKNLTTGKQAMLDLSNTPFTGELARESRSPVEVILLQQELCQQIVQIETELPLMGSWLATRQ